MRKLSSISDTIRRNFGHGMASVNSRGGTYGRGDHRLRIALIKACQGTGSLITLPLQFPRDAARKEIVEVGRQTQGEAQVISSSRTADGVAGKAERLPCAHPRQIAHQAVHSWIGLYRLSLLFVIRVIEADWQ